MLRVALLRERDEEDDGRDAVEVVDGRVAVFGFAETLPVEGRFDALPVAGRVVALPVVGRVATRPVEDAGRLPAVGVVEGRVVPPELHPRASLVRAEPELPAVPAVFKRF